MGSGDAAAWAQAYLSAAAILVSGALAVFVPWNERRLTRRREEDARLSVESSRSDTGGLRLEVTYTPQFQSHAIGVMVRVIEPTDAYVFQGVVVGETSSGDFSEQVVPGKLGTLSRYNAVSLLPNLVFANDAALRGVLFVEFGDEREGPRTALIEIGILRHYNYLASKRKMRVSQSDTGYYGNGAPIVVIKGSGD